MSADRKRPALELELHDAHVVAWRAHLAAQAEAKAEREAIRDEGNGDATPLRTDSKRARAQRHVRSDAADAEASKTALPLIWARDATPMLDVGYIVKNVIGRGELIVIYGPPKSGKTFFATDLALRVATNQTWFRHRVTPGLVIYIAAEMGARAVRRVRAWLNVNLSGAALTSYVPLAIVPRAVNLLNAIDVERLVATLEELVSDHGPPVLIIIDTLARSMVGGDENGAMDMGRVVGVADRVRDKCNAAVVLVHHSGKDAARGTRGSSALLGAADGYIRVDANEGGNHTAEVETTPQRSNGAATAKRACVTVFAFPWLSSARTPT